MKILLVDDEKLIRDVMREYCYNESQEVLEASNGEEALNIVKENANIDLIVMDIMMPKMDGYTASREIKKISDIPIIILSAREEEYDKLLGFDIGIDDYMTKPFSPKELIARIKAVLKRVNGEVDKYVYKTLEIDYRAHSVFIDKKEVKLTPKEYDLLVLFVKNDGIALSRERLLSMVWGYDFFGDDRTIDTHIKMLRNNLGKYRDLIVTVRGMGYKFETKQLKK